MGGQILGYLVHSGRCCRCLRHMTSQQHQWGGLCHSVAAAAAGPPAIGGEKISTELHGDLGMVEGDCGGGVPGRRKDIEMVEQGRKGLGREWS